MEEGMEGVAATKGDERPLQFTALSDWVDT